MRVGLPGLALAPSLVLAAAAHGQSVLVAEDGSVVIELEDSAMPLPARSDGAVPRHADLVADGEYVQVTFDLDDRLPDAPYTEWLLDAETGELVAEWTTREPTRIRRFDLDGDGDLEIIRDYARPAPCGLFVWWAPAVLGQDGFEDVNVTPRADAPARAGRVSAPRPGVQGHAVASSGDLAGEIGALFDNDPATAWRSERPGPGTWVAVEAPHGARVGGIRLSSDESERPLTVRVRFDDGASAVLEVDGLLREFALSTDGRCAVVTAADLGGREGMMLTEASLVTSTDALSPSELVAEFWAPALASACEDDRRNPREPAEVAVSLHAAAAAELLHATASSCEALALSHALESVDTSGALRLRSDAGPVALTAAQGSHFGRAALPRLAELRTESAAWSGTLHAAAQEAGSPVDLAVLLQAGVSDESLFRDALALSPHAEPIPLLSLLGENEEAEAWQRALRIALATGGDCDADAEALAAAIEADNGTVARLALRVAGDRRCASFESSADAIAASDPSPFLRAEALRTLDALDAPVCDRPRDSSPSVRTAQARLSCTGSTLQRAPNVLSSALDDENWPEVRAAWIHAAVAADVESVDGELMRYLLAESADEDIVAAFVAMRVRGTRIPVEAIDLMIARESSRGVLDAGIGVLRFADEIPVTWLQGLEAAEGYTERLQPAIDALLGTPSDQ